MVFCLISINDFEWLLNDFYYITKYQINQLFKAVNEVINSSHATFSEKDLR